MNNDNVGNKSFTFICSCGKKLRAQKEHIGKTAKCSACGNRVKVPDPAALKPKSSTPRTSASIYDPMAPTPKSMPTPQKQPTLQKRTKPTGLSTEVKVTMGVCGAIVLAVIAIIAIVVSGRTPEQTQPSGKNNIVAEKDALEGEMEEEREEQAYTSDDAKELPDAGKPETTKPAKEVRLINKDLDIDEIVQITRESVVVITSDDSVGSGFVVSDNGLIVTNYHVIGNANDSELRVHQAIWNGDVRNLTTYNKIKVVALNPEMDIAILKVEKCKIDPIKLASNEYKTGQKVVAIGNPAPGRDVLCNSVSNGIISNRAQRLGGKKYIQTTAPVNPGNSGGPLLDMHGHVIGVVTLKATQAEGIAFAVPVEDVAKLLNAYKNNSTKVQREAQSIRMSKKCQYCIIQMEACEKKAKTITDYYAEIWYKAIQARQDFNYYLRKTAEIFQVSRQEIVRSQKNVGQLIGEIKNCPEDMKKCYECILTAYGAFCEMADMADYPKESYQSFCAKKEKLHSQFKQAISQAKVLAPK